jgi:CRISPR-associated protein Csd1
MTNLVNDLIGQYDRMVKAGDLPRYGLLRQHIAYGLEVDPTGTVTGVRPLDSDDAMNIPPVPMRVTRSSGPKANYLWDATAYLLGDDGTHDRQGAEKHEAWRKTAHRYADGVHSPAARALLAFVDRPPQWERVRELSGDDTTSRLATANLTILADGKPIYDDEPLLAPWFTGFSDEGKPTGTSLVDGTPVHTALTHPSVHGVRGALATGAALVSFNKPAFTSYGFRQGENAPMSYSQAYRYAAALSAMVSDSGHTAFMGDETCVCWMDDPHDRTYRAVRTALYGAPKGAPLSFEDAIGRLRQVDADDGRRAHLLLMHANSSRLVVDGYDTPRLRTVARNILEHQQALSVMTSNGMSKPMPLWRLLSELTHDGGDVPTPLSYGITRAIVQDTPYPRRMLTDVERRIHADHMTTPARIGIIKAYWLRQEASWKGELMEGLDKNGGTPYQLGRAFAVYELIQKDALGPDVGLDIRTRWMNGASTTPARVFPRLDTLSVGHLKRIQRNNPGQAVWLKRLLTLIMSDVDGIPDRMNTEDRSRFVLGYYHQTQDLYTKHDNTGIKTDNQEKETE